MRVYLQDVVFVLFCRQIIATLKLRDALDESSEALLHMTIARLKFEHASHKHLSNKVLFYKAYGHYGAAAASASSFSLKK